MIYIIFAAEQHGEQMKSMKSDLESTKDQLQINVVPLLNRLHDIINALQATDFNTLKNISDVLGMTVCNHCKEAPIYFSNIYFLSPHAAQ